MRRRGSSALKGDAATRQDIPIVALTALRRSMTACVPEIRVRRLFSGPSQPREVQRLLEERTHREHGHGAAG